MLQSITLRKLLSTISEPFYFGGPAVSTGGSIFLAHSFPQPMENFFPDRF